MIQDGQDLGNIHNEIRTYDTKCQAALCIKASNISSSLSIAYIVFESLTCAFIFSMPYTCTFISESYSSVFFWVGYWFLSADEYTWSPTAELASWTPHTEREEKRKRGSMLLKDR